MVGGTPHDNDTDDDSDWTKNETKKKKVLLPRLWIMPHTI